MVRELTVWQSMILLGEDGWKVKNDKVVSASGVGSLCPPLVAGVET
jgi:hypothetical protein